MKLKKIILASVLLFLCLSSMPQGVNISVDGGAPDESAMLEVSSTDKGLLLPRMTTEKRDSILDPAESLLIFNTDTKCFEVYVYNIWQSLWCAEEPCYSSNPADSITGTTEICSGENTDLSVSGGSLGTNAEWIWYESACGGTPIGNGTTINVSPATNTIYYVRAEGDCDTTSCVNAEVTVLSVPDIPAAENATNVSDTAFTANWQAASDAQSYFIEVSETSDFSTIFYSNNVGDVLQQEITSLTCETTYYYHVKAVNTCGESNYSSTITETTASCPCNPEPCSGTPSVSYNGYTYNTVQIGSQCWMVENLRTTQYSNATAITEAELSADWSSLGTTGGYCSAGTGGDGYFYNYYAATSTNDLCPAGWRTPTQSDFETLMNNVPDGASIKDDINWNGTNSCGWKGLPGGYRAGSGTYYDPEDGLWWTSSSAGGGYYVDFRLYDNSSHQINEFGSPPERGQYVRCIKE